MMQLLHSAAFTSTPKVEPLTKWFRPLGVANKTSPKEAWRVELPRKLNSNSWESRARAWKSFWWTITIFYGKMTTPSGPRTMRRRLYQKVVLSRGYVLYDL